MWVHVRLMLDLLNEFARRVNGTWGKEATVKVHCSTKQVGDGLSISM
jgi:hypothetical protein